MKLEKRSILAVDPKNIQSQLAESLGREPANAEVARIFHDCVTSVLKDDEIHDRFHLLINETITDYAAWEDDD